MRTFRRFWIISLTVVAAFIVSCSVVAFISDRPPKEEKILRDFRAHRASYERVRMMLSEDKSVEGVAPWGIQLDSSPVWKIPPDGGMPVNRYQDYLALLKQIGASRVGQEGNPPEVSFGVWGSGFGGDTRHVEVLWLEHEPLNTVSSLDAFYRTDKPRHPAYVHIDGNWYIWADW